MTEQSAQQPQPMPDQPNRTWAQPINRLKVGDIPPGAINLNVEGREVMSPLQGFGQMWQRTYRVRLTGLSLTPAEIMAVWKANFPKFQPADNHFYPSMTGVQPGQVMFIDSTLPPGPGLPGVIPMASGVMILYADDVSFTVMTPQGFPESGWNTFSIFEEDGWPVAQVQSLARATDPIYEFGFRFMGGTQKQEQTWCYVLTSLASHLGVAGQVSTQSTCVDPRLQWSQARNVWHNAAVRTFFYMLATPIRRIKRR